MLAILVSLVTALGVAGVVVAPAAHAADPVLSYVGSASSAGNRTAHNVTLPATVQAGDTMVLFLTTNSTTVAVPNPTGWALLQSKDGSATRGRAWSRTAVAGDAGKVVSVKTTTSVKSAMAVSVYRSTGAGSITASASNSHTTAAKTHKAPDAAVSAAGSWLVNFWSEKSSTAQTWTAPAGSTKRTNPSGTATNKISGLLADSNGSVPTGTAAGPTATTSGSVTDVLFSVVVGPGAPGTGNSPPSASFTFPCTNLACSFDASASSDPESSPLSYSWTFGDGASDNTNTATPSHTYSSAGTKTVTLTVSDGAKTATATHQVTVTAPPAKVTQLVPDKPDTGMPKITDGEIWNMAVVGNRVFIAGSFTSIANNTATNTTSYPRLGLASYNFNTGLVDAGFHPTFNAGAAINDVQASPDGTRLYIAGSFNSITGNGVTLAKKKVAQIDMNTGQPIAAFTANANNVATELAVTNTTVYVGGRFTMFGGVTPRTGLAALNGTTGAVDSGFVNNLSGGIGTGGELTVQKLLLSHDGKKLVVVHTARQVAGQDRYGVAIIDTATKQLTSWSTRLWQDNLQFVGGIQRAYTAAISPDDSYFVVGSGSGGDRPPINDTAVAMPLSGSADVQPKWVSRCFDSVYGVAITDNAVYIGGHFNWNESPTAPDPWPGLDDVGYGTGQGLSGYGLGDAVVKREHLGALNPVDGKAMQWAPESNSFEGNKSLLFTPRGLFSGGDGNLQGGVNTGRVAFFDFNSVPAANAAETTITDPIEGRIKTTGTPFTMTGTATATTGGVSKVQVELLDRDTNQYLQDNGTFSATQHWVNATVASPGAASTTWSLPATVTDNRRLQVRARTVTGAATPVTDGTPALKKFETWALTDLAPTTSVTGPVATNGVINTDTFTVTGTADDDHGVNAVTLVFRDANNQTLQDDGTMGNTYYAFRIDPDVVGATHTTWSKEITLPHDGLWKVLTKAIDTSGQDSLDTSDRSWTVSVGGSAPTVAVTTPVSMIPPTAPQRFTVAPGNPMTFTGTAADDKKVTAIYIAMRNTSTKENLASDGKTWSQNSSINLVKISDPNLNAQSTNWSWTTPFNLGPGNYEFYVLAGDDDGATTPTAQWGMVLFTVAAPNDPAPTVTLDTTGLQTSTDPGSLQRTLTGTATDQSGGTQGIDQVKLTLRDQDTGRYLQADGVTEKSSWDMLTATLAHQGDPTTAWSLPVTLPTAGDWVVSAFAYDKAGQISLISPSAEYKLYPDDVPPTFDPTLLQPITGASFTDGQILVSGRAADLGPRQDPQQPEGATNPRADGQMAKVEVAVIDANGHYLNSSGTFGTTTAESWRTAYLNSPGSAGSNFSYTTPVIPAGTYTVKVRGTDHNDLVTTTPPTATGVTVTQPANTPPTANFTVSCGAGTNPTNVCTFDGKTSTDNDPATLTYAWSYGTGQGSGTGPNPTKTFTAPGDQAGAFNVTLTVTDKWGATNPITKAVPMAEPPTNVAPNPVINPPSCANLVCNFSAVGTTDPNTGDTVKYKWETTINGTLTQLSTASAYSYTFPANGTYQVTLTATDGWSKAGSVTRTVTVP